MYLAVAFPKAAIFLELNSALRLSIESNAKAEFINIQLQFGKLVCVIIFLSINDFPTTSFPKFDNNFLNILSSCSDLEIHIFFEIKFDLTLDTIAPTSSDLVTNLNGFSSTLFAKVTQVVLAHHRLIQNMLQRESGIHHLFHSKYFFQNSHSHK